MMRYITTQLDFTGTTNISLVGRESQIDYSWCGRYDYCRQSNVYALARLAASGGGNALVSNDPSFSHALVCNIDAITQGAVVNNGNSLMFLQSFALLTQHTINSGQIIYTCLYRPDGLDSAGVQGTSARGAENWDVKGQLAANGYNYPNDGLTPTVGTVMTTDGANNLTLQPIPVPFYFSSNPVQFNTDIITLDATFLGYRIIENVAAGPCTWTLDTGANLTSGLPAAVTGSSFAVYVSNGTGAMITLVGSLGVTVHGTPNNLSNFTMTLKYTASNTWDIFY